MIKHRKKGDILIGAKRGKGAAKHPIVYIKENDGSSFIGVVLTHGKRERYPDNIPMQAKHFVHGTEFQYKDTYLVEMLFVKPQEWGPFRKVGELTQEGINFVDSNTGKYAPQYWDNFVENRPKSHRSR